MIIANIVTKFSEDAYKDFDPSAETRKQDHIALAFKARVGTNDLDNRFYYEPMLSGHPEKGQTLEKKFLNKTFGLPIWVSSMTGGTKMAGIINRNLAKACGEFKLGMGLGSCRQLLTDDTHLADFAVRKWLGDQPLYANLGIAQIIQLLQTGKGKSLRQLVDTLEADGLIIHVNPLQEFLQPEGDRYFLSPVEVLEKVMEWIEPEKIIVKEVGQGMGVESLRAMLSLPIAALDLAASGGTNFALLEILRHQKGDEHPLQCLAGVGHSAEEMVTWINQITEDPASGVRCRQIIISGGINTFLDGYYLMEKLNLPSIYGQASGLLKYAMGDYEALQSFLLSQKEGLSVAHSFLRVKK